MYSPKVIEYIQRIFPNGTNPPEFYSNNNIGSDRFHQYFPAWPPDSFAICALLLERSGGYQYLHWSKNRKDNGDPFEIYGGSNRKQLRMLAAAWSASLTLSKDWKPDERSRLAESAAAAYKHCELSAKDIENVTEAEIQSVWDGLITHADEPIILPDTELPEQSGVLPSWWGPAVRMFIISDEASKGIGFNPRGGHDRSFPQAYLHHKAFPSAKAAPPDQYPAYPTAKIQNVCSPLVDLAAVNVMPKCRTAAVGWTLRALSHNLAYVPPTGKFRSSWLLNGVRPPATADGNEERAKTLNLLLVPYPYNVRADAFKIKQVLLDKKHGEFAISPLWLWHRSSSDTEHRSENDSQYSNRFSTFILDLITSCQKDGMSINGIVFPEMSIDFKLFNQVSTSIMDSDRIAKDFEFLIAGLVDDPDGEEGNFVGVRGIVHPSDGEAGAAKRRWNRQWSYDFLRSKHHRWRLDKRQVQRYGLSHRLNSEVDTWWEGIRIGQRRMDVFEPRAGSTIVTLICEDLARSDPCKEAIRAIGPNLVIALLMDGPQVKTRWPAHYAGVLSDDPGSSVLTLTSIGMINRATVRDSSRSRSVAFWKDSSGAETELQLPEGAHALAISLVGRRFEEKTLDGRGDGGSSYRWELSDVMSVRVPENTVNQIGRE